MRIAFARRFAAFLLAACLAAPLFAQDAAELPLKFRGISLGMSLDDLKAALKKDGMFDFRGDPDVSYLPSKTENLVETTGHSYIRRAFFQLADGKLYIMAYMLDPDQIDYYSVFTTFTGKYGQPASLDPRESVWENDAVRISVERPLTVKYIDKKVFSGIVARSGAEGLQSVQLRKEFLNDF